MKHGKLGLMVLPTQERRPEWGEPIGPGPSSFAHVSPNRPTQFEPMVVMDRSS